MPNDEQPPPSKAAAPAVHRNDLRFVFMSVDYTTQFNQRMNVLDHVAVGSW